MNNKPRDFCESGAATFPLPREDRKTYDIKCEPCIGREIRANQSRVSMQPAKDEEERLRKEGREDTLRENRDASHSHTHTHILHTLHTLHTLTYTQYSHTREVLLRNQKEGRRTAAHSKSKRKDESKRKAALALLLT